MSVVTFSPMDNLPVLVAPTIQTFTDLYGEVWIALNGADTGGWQRARDVLHGMAYRNATWNIATSIALVQLDSVQSDPYGMWTGAPTYGFTLPVPGWWRVHAQVNGTSTAVNQYISVQIWQNANQRSLDNTISPLSGGGNCGRSYAEIVAAVGDVVTLKAANPPGAAGQTGFANVRLEVSYLGTG